MSLFVGRDDGLDWIRLCQRGFTFLIISLVCFLALQSVRKCGTPLIISKCRKISTFVPCMFTFDMFKWDFVHQEIVSMKFHI